MYMNSNRNQCEKSHVASGLGGLTTNSQNYLPYGRDCPCTDCVSAPVCKHSEDCIRLCEELGVGKTTDKPFSVAVRCCHKYSIKVPGLDITYYHNDAIRNGSDGPDLDESLSLAHDPLP